MTLIHDMNNYYANNNGLFGNDIKSFTFLINKPSLPSVQVVNCLKNVFPNEIVPKGPYITYHFPLLLFKLAKFVGNFLKSSGTCLLVLSFIYLSVISHDYAQKIILRNSQNYIYPLMRLFRFWTLPILKKHDFISDWHEEECLVINPFFYELPLDCWPCENVRTLVDLTGFNDYSSKYVFNEQPFVVRDSLQDTVLFSDLKELYSKYNLAIDRGAARYLCSEKDFCSPKDVLSKVYSPRKDFQVLWKINRVTAARVLRKIFPRPYFIPKTSEVALERFLYLSGPEAPHFFLPLTDFANVWIAQGQGYRLIILDPSKPCWSNCSTVSIVLRPRDILYYNWQFWRLRSHPANFSQERSITFMGSFY